MRRPVRLLAWVCCVLAMCAAPAWAQAPAGGSSQASGPAGGKLPDTLPVRRDPSPGSPPLAWNPALAVLALGAAAGAWWMWTRRAGGRGVRPSSGAQTAIVRVSSQALTPQASVHAVQWGGEELLLGCTSQGVVLLSRRPVAPQGDDAS